MARQFAGLAANPPALTRQDLFLSFACSIADIPSAAGAPYPFSGLLLSPVVAAGAMALSSGASMPDDKLKSRRVQVAVEQVLPATGLAYVADAT